MTREKSKAVQETENPFADDEDEEANSPTKNTLSPAAAASGGRGSTATASYGESKAQSHSHGRSPSSGSFFGSSSSKKKEKEKEREKQQQKNANKVRRPFRLEDHKDEIKVAIADGNFREIDGRFPTQGKRINFGAAQSCKSSILGAPRNTQATELVTPN